MGLTLCLMLCCLIGLGGCTGGSSPDGAAAAPRSRPPAPVQVEKAESRTLTPSITVMGSVTPMRKSVIASGASGVVAEFLVREGDYVENQQILSKLQMKSTELEIEEAKKVFSERELALKELEGGYRTEEVEEAEAKMKAARAVRDNSITRLNRVKMLLKEDGASPEDLDDAVEKSEAAEQNLAAAVARYKLLKGGYDPEVIEQARARKDAQKAHVGFLENEREKRITLAPFSGYVVAEHTEIGQFLKLGDPIATIAHLDDIEIVAVVDEQHIELVQPDSQVMIRLSASSSENWEGKVVAFVPKSEWEEGSRGFPVKVRVTNKYRTIDAQRKMPILNEGMTARVTFVGTPVPNALVVPKDAIVRGTRGSLVYLFLPAKEGVDLGTVVPVPVEEGLAENEWIQVFTSELKEGVMVVVEGGERLVPMQEVRRLTLPQAASN